MGRVFCDDEASAQPGRGTRFVARVAMFLSGFTSGGDDGKYYKAMSSSFDTDHLSEVIETTFLHQRK